jgi:hypothetical protein
MQSKDTSPEPYDWEIDQDMPFKVAQQRLSQMSQNNASKSGSVVERYSDSESKYEYKVHLSCKFHVEFHQTVAVIGGIPELGMWKNNQLCKLKWTEGDIWKTEKPITTSKPFF